MTKINDNPSYKVVVIDDGTFIGELGPTPDQAKAKQWLERQQRSYPYSEMQISFDHGAWKPVDDALLAQVAYTHTYNVLGLILAEGLPRLSWQIHEWKPAALEGHLSADSEDEARQVMAAYATLLESEIVERDGDALHLNMDAVWHGVQIDVRAYFRRPKPTPAVSAEQPVEVTA